MRKILFYSDCFVFSGSENVIENILLSEEIGREYETCFFYAFSKTYEEGLYKKITPASNIKPFFIINAFTRWRYGLQFRNNIPKRLYYSFRYVISGVFKKIGVHNLYNGFLLYRLFKKERPDIICINNGGYPAAESCRMAAISARLAGIKKVCFIVNNMAFPPKGRIDRFIDKYVNNAVSFFITASKAARDQLVKVRAFPPEKCINIPNTLSVLNEQHTTHVTGKLRKEFGLGDKVVVLGAVGLLTARKGFNVLIDAIHELGKKAQTGTDYKVLIFGEGEERPALEALITRYQLDSRILLPGYRADILSYVKDFDVFLIPSVSNEDFPYVVIEAMALGKPVIGSNIAGIPEQVEHGVNGFITPAGEPGRLADAIHSVLQQPPLIRELGENGKNRYHADFSNQLIMRRYLKLFNDIVK